MRYGVDDGTGIAHCMYWLESADDVLNDGQLLALGQFVQVLGKLEWRCGQPSVVTTRVHIAANANAESFWWQDLHRVHEQVYSREFPIALPPSTRVFHSQLQHTSR